MSLIDASESSDDDMNDIEARLTCSRMTAATYSLGASERLTPVSAASVSASATPVFLDATPLAGGSSATCGWLSLLLRGTGALTMGMIVGSHDVGRGRCAASGTPSQVAHSSSFLPSRPRRRRAMWQRPQSLASPLHTSISPMLLSLSVSITDGGLVAPSSRCSNSGSVDNSPPGALSTLCASW